MKKNKTSLLSLFVTLTLSFGGYAQTALAQRQKPPRDVKTDSAMIYHGGPIMTFSQDVYVVWYGCWDDNCGISGDTATQFILSQFLSSLGGSPYFQINATYPNSSGHAPNGGLLFGGAVFDRYSHGNILTAADIQGIINDKIEAWELPQDPHGIYLVLASGDVSSNDTGFCIPSAQPFHGRGLALGSSYPFGFVGNPVRCPTVAAPQFIASDGTRLPTPNGNFGADGMASTIAHLLNVIVTNPFGGAWYDRYELENADKCVGQFGSTWLTANGARANLNVGGRDYLIQQNWVNSDRKPHCAMNSSL